MHPGKFEYHKASSVDEAVSLGGGDASFLAGGHSLIPAMKLRL
ncbi:MAG TPA: xanthine dehydrogenase family protein subunit M, partial [Candidatus Marinimicrobia bacterium]|nr:xanthine dehydrogenase family protein subunit M [Candidatus Neomarinimicrobiota bacterium]